VVEVVVGDALAWVVVVVLQELGVSKQVGVSVEVGVLVEVGVSVEVGVLGVSVLGVFVDCVVFVEVEAFEGIFLLAVLDIILLELLLQALLPRDIDLHLVVDIELQETHPLQGILQEVPTVFELEYPIGFVFVPIVVVVLGVSIVPVQELSIVYWLEISIVLGLFGGVPMVQKFV
jgi:hypothetical protein